jgi:hypothetical protein
LRGPAAAALGVACVGLVAASYGQALSLPHFAEWYIEHQVACGQGFRPEELVLGRGPYYRPAGYWINQLVCTLGGREPRPFRDHALWLLVHLTCVGLIFALLRGTCGTLSASAAALGFGLHPSLTPVVVYPVPWMALVGLLLLLAFAVYTPIVRSPAPTHASWARSLAGAALTLLVSLVCEPGACAAAALALWLLLEAWRRGDRRWGAQVAGPAVAAVALYVGLRGVAMGAAFFKAYVGPPPNMHALVWVWARNAVYEAGVWVNPVHLPFADHSAEDRTILRLYVVAFLGVLGLTMGWKPLRRFLCDHPLPTLGLVLHVLLQMNSNWLVVKEPIGRAGIDRSYLQYFPLVLVALLAGPALARLAAALRPPGRGVLASAVLVWLGAAAAAQQDALALAAEGGRILRADRATLAPFLRTLPEGTVVVPCGFPEAVRAPYLPWAWVYFFSREAIFSEWAGHHIGVPTPLGDHPAPAGFAGFMLWRTPSGILRARSGPGTPCTAIPHAPELRAAAP